MAKPKKVTFSLEEVNKILAALIDTGEGQVVLQTTRGWNSTEREIEQITIHPSGAGVEIHLVVDWGVEDKNTALIVDVVLREGSK